VSGGVVEGAVVMRLIARVLFGAYFLLLLAVVCGVVRVGVWVADLIWTVGGWWQVGGVLMVLSVMGVGVWVVDCAMDGMGRRGT